MPAYLSDQTVMRIVCRNGISHDLAENLMADFRTETAFLEALQTPMPHPGIGDLHH